MQFDFLRARLFGTHAGIRIAGMIRKKSSFGRGLTDDTQSGMIAVPQPTIVLAILAIPILVIPILGIPILAIPILELT